MIKIIKKTDTISFESVFDAFTILGDIIAPFSDEYVDHQYNSRRKNEHKPYKLKAPI